MGSINLGPGQAVFDISRPLNGMQVLKGAAGTSGGQDSTGGRVNITNFGAKFRRPGKPRNFLMATIIISYS